ncbi:MULTISPECIES: hypothetical protein [Planktothricoides]|uniref:hypothetical protein n=1 Tax=Planktothricoides TaxID=132607 RepID=UPI0006C2BFE7|nr:MULTISPECIES: hypothetical protein [Planktothricoides]KOR38493.1 hypothetical protein AM228_00395 [Planktothricoides sp. SR001]
MLFRSAGDQVAIAFSVRNQSPKKTGFLTKMWAMMLKLTQKPSFLIKLTQKPGFFFATRFLFCQRSLI